MTSRIGWPTMASTRTALTWTLGAGLVMLSVGSAWAAGFTPPPPVITTTQAAPTAPAVTPTGPVWPDLGWSTLAWFAAVAVLMLTIQPKPWLRLRNLDALVLAGMCLLLGLREASGTPPGSACTWQWWALLGLTGAVVYWFLRGAMLLLARGAVQSGGMVSGGVRLVLVLAGMGLAIQQLATAPLTPGSRDGLVGGLCTAATGKLPYGDATDYAAQSPLLYLVHAGAVRLLPPTYDWNEDAAPQTMTWENRARWLDKPWQEYADLAAARLVNAVLFVGVLLGMYTIGSRWRAAGSGWLMVALLCVFPGTRECLTRPDVMLPALLLTWTLAFALLPWLGGLLALLTLVLAGLAWPWAWLALPVVLAYHWRRGWQAFGSTLGLLGGLAAIVLGLAWLVQPALPRADGALASAGFQPLYAARLTDDRTLLLDQREGPEQIPSTVATVRLWHWLVTRESAALAEVATGPDALRIEWPNGVTGRNVLYRQVAPQGDALPLLQQAYRDAVRQMPDSTRIAVAARTVLEATWLPARFEAPPVTGTWRLWGGPPPMTGRWVIIRRMVKLSVALLAVWAALVIFVGGRTQPRNLLGALLITLTGALVASELGAATNLIYLLPLIAALWAVHEPAPPPARVVSLPATIPPADGPIPRITNDQAMGGAPR
ncbi:MAG: hypothetical protein KA383_11305 [Phycisphaerae bacterium]|nr:hypothetical protein [Phycisphaerae bacterium]